MALRFLTSPIVAAGEPLRSRDLAKQSRACNRIKLSGLGDTAWRDVWYSYNAVRQVRNPDELGNYPPEGEWWEIYQHLDPANDIATWPVAEAGDYEGINLAMNLGAFTFGINSLPNEELRLGDYAGLPLWYGLDAPSTPTEFWELGKMQRGVIVPGGDQNAPALLAAQGGQYLVGGGFNPHGKSWGGMLPTPLLLEPQCGSGGTNYPSYQIFFTALAAGVPLPPNIPRTGVTIDTNPDGMTVVIYSGTCVIGMGDSTFGHVQGINRFPKVYRVASNDGSGNIIWDDFPTADWLEGPYGGEGQFYRYDGAIISRAVFDFVRDFRGTASQRNPDTFSIEEIAFDNEAFKTRQYHLSPNRGQPSGAGLEALYPTATATISAPGKISKGTVLTFGSQESYAFHAGFVMTGIYAIAENLFEATSLEVIADGIRIGTLTLTPAEPSALKYFATVYAPAALEVKLAADARFSAAGGITFECNEIAEYTPDHWDTYMLLRLAATLGGTEGSGPFLDGSGIDYTAAKSIFDNYEAYGIVYNPNAAGVRTAIAAINQTPVYESARRKIQDRARIVHRRQMLTYEVIASQAIIRFKRWAYGLSEENKADYFAGIAPDWRGVTSVVEDEQYIVRSHTGGSIVYRGQRYGHEKRFTGKAGHSEFLTNGDAVLLEYDGIKATARKKGWTNEWCAFFNFHPTNSSGSSIWKAENYSDYYTWINRAHFYAVDGAYPRALKRMLTLVNTNNAADYFSPEGPSSTNYYPGTNGTPTEDFCKSNPLYPAPYDIESATVEFDAAGEDVVKLVFKTRFQTTETAPATRAQDYAAWSAGDRVDTFNEAWRSDDNGLAEYLLYDRDSVYPSVKTGDAADGSVVHGLPDNPTGCIIPHMFLSRLERIPYEDDNDIWQSYDSRAIVENLGSKEYFLKTACEGFVDGFATSTRICDGGVYPFDYLFENLCVEAFGGRYIGDGHGPLPNTKTRSEHFNQVSRCLNLLRMVRVDGAIEFQAREHFYNYSGDIVPSAGAGSCPPGTAIAYWNGPIPAAPEVSVGSWLPNSTGVQSSWSAGLVLCGSGGTNAGVETGGNSFEFRLVPSTAFAWALSDELQELIDTGNVAVFGTLTEYLSYPSTSEPYPGTGSCATLGTVFFSNVRERDYGCVVVTSGGSITAAPALSGNFYVCGMPEVGNASIRIRSLNITNVVGTAVITVPFEDETLQKVGGSEIIPI